MSVTAEKKSEYNKRYFEKHKDQLKEKAKDVVECEICKKFVSRGALYQHRQSKIHQLNVELFEERQKDKKVNRIVNSLKDDPEATRHMKKKAKKLMKLLDN